MASFTMDAFAKRLLAESLFYDEEYGAIGTISLIDVVSSKEMFVAAYVPEEQAFVIESATDWEDLEAEEIDEIGYALAVDSEEHAVFGLPEEAAEELLTLAATYDLHPSVTLIFEAEE
jgi:hypothetical protein